MTKRTLWLILTIAFLSALSAGRVSAGYVGGIHVPASVCPAGSTDLGTFGECCDEQCLKIKEVRICSLNNRESSYWGDCYPNSSGFQLSNKSLQAAPTYSCSQCDMDFDTDVDFYDLVRLSACVGTTPGTTSKSSIYCPTLGDFNKDGKINASDIAIFSSTTVCGQYSDKKCTADNKPPEVPKPQQCENPSGIFGQTRCSSDNNSYKCTVANGTWQWQMSSCGNQGCNTATGLCKLGCEVCSGENCGGQCDSIGQFQCHTFGNQRVMQCREYGNCKIPYWQVYQSCTDQEFCQVSSDGKSGSCIEKPKECDIRTTSFRCDPTNNKIRQYCVGGKWGYNKTCGDTQVCPKGKTDCEDLPIVNRCSEPDGAAGDLTCKGNQIHRCSTIDRESKPSWHFHQSCQNCTFKGGDKAKETSFTCEETPSLEFSCVNSECIGTAIGSGEYPSYLRCLEHCGSKQNCSNVADADAFCKTSTDGTCKVYAGKLGTLAGRCDPNCKCITDTCIDNPFNACYGKVKKTGSCEWAKNPFIHKGTCDNSCQCISDSTKTICGKENGSCSGLVPNTGKCNYNGQGPNTGICSTNCNCNPNPDVCTQLFPLDACYLKREGEYCEWAASRLIYKGTCKSCKCVQDSTKTICGKLTGCYPQTPGTGKCNYNSTGPNTGNCTPNCDCLPIKNIKYKCGVNGACVEDANGKYSDNTCNNECIAEIPKPSFDCQNPLGKSGQKICGTDGKTILVCSYKYGKWYWEYSSSCTGTTTCTPSGQPNCTQSTSTTYSAIEPDEVFFNGQVSGSIISNGAITLVDPEGKKYVTKTDAEGNYSLKVKVGQLYKVTISSPGYKDLIFDWTPTTTNKNYFADVKLEKLEGPTPGSFEIKESDRPVKIIAGWNLLTLPLSPTEKLTAKTWLEEINLQGGQVASVSKWEDSRWETYTLDITTNDFPIEIGKAYFIKADKNSNWQMAGEEQSRPVTIDLSPGWNLIGPSKTSCQLNNQCSASVILNSTRSQIFSRFESGLWESLAKEDKESYGQDFKLENFRGYALKTNRRVKFSP